MEDVGSQCLKLSRWMAEGLGRAYCLLCKYKYSWGKTAHPFVCCLRLFLTYSDKVVESPKRLAHEP